MGQDSGDSHQNCLQVHLTVILGSRWTDHWSSSFWEKVLHGNSSKVEDPYSLATLDVFHLLQWNIIIRLAQSQFTKRKIFRISKHFVTQKPLWNEILMDKTWKHLLGQHLKNCCQFGIIWRYIFHTFSMVELVQNRYRYKRKKSITIHAKLYHYKVIYNMKLAL